MLGDRIGTAPVLPGHCRMTLGGPTIHLTSQTLSGLRQSEGECRPLAWFGLYPDASPMAVDNLFAHRKTNAGAWNLPPVRRFSGAKMRS